MVTVVRFIGLRVVIYSNDHRPAHVHVIGPSKEAVFNMPAGGTPELRESYGFTGAELKYVAGQLLLYRATILEKWKAIHG